MKSYSIAFEELIHAYANSEVEYSKPADPEKEFFSVVNRTKSTFKEGKFTEQRFGELLKTSIKQLKEIM
jgi:hypothetical protein